MQFPTHQPRASPRSPWSALGCWRKSPRQRVRIAKEELKRARKRVKEAKREAKRARKQADAARKAWKKARKAHLANSPSKASGRKRARAQTAKGPAGGPQRKNERKSTRRRRNTGKAPKSAALKSEAPLSQVDGSAPANPSSET